ncbi:MAG: aldehyde dehydrogenase family protein, partial [Actinomycetota bacterium]|nr:aldehyde dehydrogenase family protein [Actinomycetota bacterium]
MTTTATRTVHNIIAGQERPAASGQTLEKRAPATGQLLSHLARSRAEDVDAAVSAAVAAQPAWARETPVARGAVLRRIAQLLERDAREISRIVADETGKPLKDALGETAGAVEQGYFMAGEGRRLYGRTTTSAVAHRQAMTVRQPLGVAGLIIAANTPLPNVAWKVFPALICGNAAVLKASEDTPHSAVAFARLALEAGLPAGVLNVVQGLGPEAGQPIVEDPRVAVVSFTGSTSVGRMIARVAGERLAKVCLELGGKNPLVVCDDADLPRAAQTAALSAYSNAGQRCAAGSRIIVLDAVYERFKELLLERTNAQRVGSGDEHDLGPVISERQLEHMLAKVREAKEQGATILAGGHRLTGEHYGEGFYIAPTLVEGSDELSATELFGPITTLHRVAGFDEAI